MSIDVTELWRRSHQHLQPYQSSAKDRRSLLLQRGSVLANIRFEDSWWANAVEVNYEQNPLRFWIEDLEVSRILETLPQLKSLNPDQIDARLWTRDITMINIEPTTRCNFSCWYCVGRQMVQEDIDPDNFPRLLANFPNLKTIALVGEGEPLMHKSFFKMARQARDYGARVLIISNGSTLSSSVVRQLCEAEVAYVAISIDSIDSATFARSRIGGDLHQIWRGIERLRAYRDSNGFKYPKIALKGTLFSYSQHELPTIVNEAFSRGIEIFESFQALNPKESYVQFYPKDALSEVHMAPKVSKTMSSDLANFINPMKTFEAFCLEEGIEIPTPKNNRLRNNCDETWLYALLSGDVTPCCQVKQSPSEQWNVFHRPVDSILADESFENLRFNLWNGLFPEFCKSCWKTL
jgi:MoaA/NifB/PqqE/SkfB family radical SAM enzyme